jgi:hypothetical protein
MANFVLGEERELPRAHLELFIESIKSGHNVTYVEGSKILAVDNPQFGYVTLQLLDKIVDNDE